MHRIAERFKLRKGMEVEYKMRHDEIWPQMKTLMEEVGIRNYSIWLCGEDLFSYFEVDDVENCIHIIKDSKVKKQWDNYMSDIIYPVEICSGNNLSNMQLMYTYE
jgi:L-rhamnose mutarotase